ncbi:MAG: hypothetical protein P8Y70_13280 [Candidatus Lokiarchaeota archaeon]
MKFKQKTKKTIQIVLMVTLLATIFAFPGFSNFSYADPPQRLPCGATYRWTERTLSFSFNKVWNNEVVICNESGVSQNFDTYNRTYTDELGNFVQVETTTQSVTNFSQYSKTVTTGSVSMQYNFEVFQVTLDYGNSLQMIWMAIKKGTFLLEYTADQINKTYKYHTNTTCSTIDKYNIYSDESMTTLSDSYSEENVYNWSENTDDEYSSEDEYHRVEGTFSSPIILTCQLVTTKTGEKLAWAELFGDFIVYNDTNYDNIYSAGESSSSAQMNLFSSDEWKGVLIPSVGIQSVYMETQSGNMSYIDNSPTDVNLDDYIEKIQFTPPSQGINNNVTWGIKYPDIPLAGFVQNGLNSYFLSPNSTFSEMGSANLSYIFNYEVGPSSAAMDYTFSLDEVSDPLYTAVQGLSLAVPHYTYLLSNFKIHQTAQSFLSSPKDSFNFIVNGSEVAQIDFSNPVKKDYELCDYPEVGKNSTYEAIGASVNLLISENNHYATPVSGGNMLQNLIYTLNDFVALDSKFTVNDNLFSMETQNYPHWSGHKIVHDPTLRVKFSDESILTPDQPDDTPPDDTPPNPDDIPQSESIPGYPLYLFMSSLALGLTIILVKVNLNYKNKRNC